MKILLSLVLWVFVVPIGASAQIVQKAAAEKPADRFAAETELNAFYNEYAEDHRQAPQEAIVGRYDPFQPVTFG